MSPNTVAGIGVLAVFIVSLGFVLATGAVLDGLLALGRDVRGVVRWLLSPPIPYRARLAAWLVDLLGGWISRLAPHAQPAWEADSEDHQASEDESHQASEDAMWRDIEWELRAEGYWEAMEDMGWEWRHG